MTLQILRSEFRFDQLQWEGFSIEVLEYEFLDMFSAISHLSENFTDFKSRL